MGFKVKSPEECFFCTRWVLLQLLAAGCGRAMKDGDDAMLSDDDGVTSVMCRRCCGHWPLVSSVYSVPQYLESGVCTGASPGHYTAIGKGKAKVTFRYVTLVTLLGTWSWSLSITVTLLRSLNKFCTKIFIIYNT